MWWESIAGLAPSYAENARKCTLPKHSYLSAYPNASIPAYTDGKFHYEGDAEYFRQSAIEFRNQGVRLLGGCCGTTPDHIKAFSDVLKGLPPIEEKETKAINKVIVSEKPSSSRELPPLQDIVREKPSVIVELIPKEA